MKIQVKIKGKTRNVRGTQKSKVDGVTVLQIGNSLYRIDSPVVTDLGGNPLNEDIFTVKSNPLNELKEKLMMCNGYSTKKIDGVWSDMLAEIQIKAEGLEGVGSDYGNTKDSDEFVAKVCKSVRLYNKCSEKQAFIIAKYAINKNIF